MRTFPVEHLRFLFRPVSIWSHSGRSVRKSPSQALIFLFPCFLFLSSEHWSHSGERRCKLSRSVAPNYNCSPLQASRARQSRLSELPSRTPWPNIQNLFSRYQPAKLGTHLGGSLVRRLSSALSLFGGSTLGSGRALSSEPSPRTARQTRIKLYPFKLYVSVNS